MTDTVLSLIAAKLNRELTQDDQIAWMDYCAFYGLEKDEFVEYVDSFIDECYQDQELVAPDKLPFAHYVHKGNWHSWTWGGCTILKLDN